MITIITVMITMISTMITIVTIMITMITVMITWLVGYHGDYHDVDLTYVSMCVRDHDYRDDYHGYMVITMITTMITMM